MHSFFKRCVTITIFAVFAAVLIRWFFLGPRKAFYIGMTEAEIRKVLGKSCNIKPSGIAYSAPPTEFELKNIPAYCVEVPWRRATLYLNSFKEVTCIRFPFGPAKGNLITTVPNQGIAITNSE